MTLARPSRHAPANYPTFRPQMEHLEDRSVPATFNVTTTLDVVDAADGKRSLREAITAANNLAGADVIVLPAGVYKIALSGAGEDANATGDFDIAGSVTIQGAGAGATVIDGQQLDRVFDVLGSTPSSLKVIFQGLTVRNGNVTGRGGGILYGNADVVVRDCVVSGNGASQKGGGVSDGTGGGTGNLKVVRTTVSRNVAGTTGGGLFVASGSTLTATDTVIRRNLAHSVGGGIDNDTPTLTRCTLSGNTAPVGGGMETAVATMTNCTITGNSASDGGGLHANELTLTNCTISGNTATIGGGIHTGSANLSNCTVSGNSATTSSGGGIQAETSVTMTNCTVSGNMAATNGGGLFTVAATLLHCTIVENNADNGGGVFHQPAGTFNVRSTIIALNLTDFGGPGPDVSGFFTSQGHNLIGNGSGGTGFTNGDNGDMIGTAANPIDPKLGPLQNNGGPTKTHALLAGSPAIDHGDSSLLLATDQRGFGFPRKKDGNGDGRAVVDVGAFEK
jgi:predicted outer membrane repeat protein